MAMRHDGSSIGLAMFHYSHELRVMTKHVFPSFWGLHYLRYLALLMTDGYEKWIGQVHSRRVWLCTPRGREHSLESNDIYFGKR